MAANSIALEIKGRCIKIPLPQEITDLGTSLTNLIFHGSLFGNIFAIALLRGLLLRIQYHVIFALHHFRAIGVCLALPVALAGSIVLLIIVSVSLHPEGEQLGMEALGLVLVSPRVVMLANQAAYVLFVVGPHSLMDCGYRYGSVLVV